MPEGGEYRWHISVAVRERQRRCGEPRGTCIRMRGKGQRCTISLIGGRKVSGDRKLGKEKKEMAETGKRPTSPRLSTVTYCPAYLYPARPDARGAECVHPVENWREELPPILSSSASARAWCWLFSRLSGSSLPLRTRPVESLVEKGDADSRRAARSANSPR